MITFNANGKMARFHQYILTQYFIMTQSQIKSAVCLFVLPSTARSFILEVLTEIEIIKTVSLTLAR